MTKGDLTAPNTFCTTAGGHDRAEGALTDAALFLHDNKRAYDLTKPGHRAEFAETKRKLCRVYDALAAQGERVNETAGRRTEGVAGRVCHVCESAGVTGRTPRPSLRSASSPQSEELAAEPA